jgi:cytochrome P450
VISYFLINTASLADAEMRLVLAHLLFNFNFQLVDKDSKWEDQEAYVLYMKKPLMVHVKSRSSL